MTSFAATGKKGINANVQNTQTLLRTNTEKVFWVFGYCDLFSKQTRKILFKVIEIISVIYNNHKKKAFFFSFRPHKNKNHGEKNGGVIQ